MNIIEQLEQDQMGSLTAGKEIPDFAPGDTLIVNVKVVEGERSRVQAYEGVCIARSGGGINSNFTFVAVAASPLELSRSRTSNVASPARPEFVPRYRTRTKKRAGAQTLACFFVFKPSETHIELRYAPPLLSARAT
ncbi:MAG: 50S ribosomal protein L19 [Parvibaculum sp.]|nr:50S ribosomal protein L19 [Parvibaculum sp.]